ncbi:MAG: hypothetical protein U0840_22430 [Gemmataceae bacterium]
MNRRWLRGVGVLILTGLVLGTPGAAQVNSSARQVTPFVPKFEAVAETRLLMEGLAHANYRSVSKHLRTGPGDVETWSFARGQAILIAETGNLLLLRPPRNSGRDTWMRLGMDLREKATVLARSLALRDLGGSKAALVEVTASCNRCHTTFKVPRRVAPDPDPVERDAE